MKDVQLIDLVNNSNAYDFAHLVMWLNFNADDLKNNLGNIDEKLAIVVHEYVHYLQSVTTTFGIKYLLDLFNAHLDIVLYLNHDVKAKPTLPLKNIQSDKLANTYERLKRIKTAYKTDEDLISFKDKPNNDTGRKYIKKVCFEEAMSNNQLYLADEERDCWVPITAQTIRENMAMMATYYSRQIGQDSVLYTLNDYPPKYSILFRHIYNKYQFVEDARLFVFYLCEFALMSDKPNIELDNLLLYIDDAFKKNNFDYSNVNDFFNHLMGDYNGMRRLRTISEVLKESIETKIQFNSKYQHDYIKAVTWFYKIFEHSIWYKKNMRTLVYIKMDGEWIDNMAEHFYSPLVIFNGRSKLFGKNNIEFQDAISCIFTLSIVIDKAYSDDISECPFLNEFPFCGIKDRQLDICQNNAISIEVNKDGEGCPLYNCLMILNVKNQYPV